VYLPEHLGVSLTHTLLIQAIQLQPLSRRRARSPRPGNPLDRIQGMDEDAICARWSVAGLRYRARGHRAIRTYRVRHAGRRSVICPVFMEAGSGIGRRGRASWGI
jgi:hypothetical protein